MKKIIILCLLIFISQPSLASDITLNSISDSLIESVTNEKGFKFLLMHKKKLPVFNIDITFRNSGYAYDAPSKQGLAYFVAQLMKEGNNGIDALDFSKDLKKLGAKVHYFVSKENFSISLRVLVENVEPALMLIRKVMTDPKMDDVTFHRIKSRQVALLNKDMEDPNYVAMHQLSKIIYGSHSYSNSMLGNKEAIDAFTAEDVRHYLQSSFSMVNIVVSAVGDVKAAEIVSILNKSMLNLPEVVTDVKKVQYTKLKTSKRDKHDFFFEMNVPQNVIYFACNGIGINDDDYYNAVLLNYILGGGGLNSLLMSSLRGDKGLTYGVRTDLVHNKNSDVFLGFLSTSNATSAEAMQTLKKVLSDIKSDGIKLKDFEAAKYNVVNSFVLGLETNAQLVQFLNYIQLNNLSTNYVEHYLDAIDGISLANLNKFARAFLDLDKFVFVEVGKKV